MTLRSLALLAALALAFPTLARAEDKAPVAAAAPKPPSVTVVPAERRELVARVSVTGTLVPRETVVVGSDIAGLRIEALLADEGDRVEAGAVLARLSTDMIEVELAQNASQVSRSDAAARLWAMPKSTRRVRPSAESRTLPGFTSRWITPR